MSEEQAFWLLQVVCDRLCQDTIGTIVAGKALSLRLICNQQSVYAWHTSRPVGIRVPGSEMFACYQRLFPWGRCTTIGGFAALVLQFVQ